ncbi:MAG: glycerophosphodiester phosphodiesterase [Clostridia bacterium]|nr:glycerophosphodiester phosphodiesterase [Clostridia bacterium]
MIYFLLSIALLFVIYLLLLRGRVGFADFTSFKNVSFAHRGLHGEGVPENSLWAFRRAKERGYGSELDVHLMADGNLAVIHDHSLKRIAGADVKIEDLTLADLDNYRLEGTDEKIPTLKQVLDLYDGKAPLIIELKATEKNADKLCRNTALMLKSYKGKYCIESFNPKCVHWFKKHCPQIIRGQLSENFFKSKGSELPIVLKFVMTFLLTNFSTKPDFIAYKFKDRNNISFKICTKLLKMQGFSWTVREKEIEISKKENLIPIFEEKKTV